MMSRTARSAPELFALLVADPTAPHQWDSLTDEEAARARRFLVEAARRAFVHTRAALRLLLARELGLDHPRDVRFVTGPHGKPALAADLYASRPVEFNVSHSHHHALIAWCEGRRVGVDLEQISKRVDIELLMPRVFSRAERGAIAALEPARRRDAFFRVWSRKEAYIKALGVGLSLELSSFDVSCDELPRLLDARHEGAQPERWCYAPIELDLPGYAAALVVERLEGAAHERRVVAVSGEFFL
jgi:4'-phosphopantetheinyl transferase